MFLLSTHISPAWTALISRSLSRSLPCDPFLVLPAAPRPLGIGAGKSSQKMRQTFNFPNKPGLFLSVALPAVALSLISPSNDTTEKLSHSHQAAATGAEQLASDKTDIFSLNGKSLIFIT